MAPTEYSKEVCLYLLQNPELIEGDTLTDYVEYQVFKAINTGISKKIGSAPWRTRLGLVTGDEAENEDTIFSKPDWPKKEYGVELVGFRLWENDAGINDYWLSHALGLNGGTLCFDFFVEAREGGPSKYMAKQRLESLFNKNDKIKKAGFVHHQRGSIYLGFTLDRGKVIAEFPNLNSSLAPLFSAMDTIIKLSGEFDAIVKEIYPESATQTEKSKAG